MKTKRVEEAETMKTAINRNHIKKCFLQEISTGKCKSVLPVEI